MKIMDEKKYEVSSCDTYQKFPRLISGLKDRCLASLIKSDDLLMLRIVPSQRE
jgi:hypothetical protein